MAAWIDGRIALFGRFSIMLSNLQPYAGRKNIFLKNEYIGWRRFGSLNLGHLVSFVSLLKMISPSFRDAIG